jgi:CelD/BcsL family acetyltransferase involved in cellulose biosynthesis
MCVEHSRDAGVEEFSFLRGDEKYKFEWTNTVAQSFDIVLFRRRYFREFARIAHICASVRRRLRARIRPSR